MITYPCGCVNEIHEPSGILHGVSKCGFHLVGRRDPAKLGAAYYTELAQLDHNDFGDSRYLDQIYEALGEFPAPSSEPQALEIGCGISPYAGALQAAGWRYIGLDSSPWAAGWTAKRYGVVTLAKSWEWWKAYPSFGLVLCCHALEHMRDAPAAIAKMAGVLVPGGELWVIVPDDSDPVNPDHIWHFSLETLRAAIEMAGFTVERLESRRIVERENFLFVRAKKS